MRKSFEAQQTAAIDTLVSEGHENIARSIEEAQRLRESISSRTTIVLEFGTGRHEAIIAALDIRPEKLFAWSRGNLPGVTVYEIAA